MWLAAASFDSLVLVHVLIVLMETNHNVVGVSGGAVNEARFSMSGDLLASASEDKTLRVWSVQGWLLHLLFVVVQHCGWLGLNPGSP